MRHSLVWKLTTAFFVTALTVAALTTVFFQVTNVDRLAQLVTDQQRSSLQTLLGQYYEVNHSWAGIAEEWSSLRSQSLPTRIIPSRTTSEPTIQPLDRPRPDRQNNFGLADEHGVVLVANGPEYPVGSTIPFELLKGGAPVIVDGKRVGTILSAPVAPDFKPEENLFLQRTNDSILGIAIVVTLTALIIGIILVRTLTRPLKALTQAAQNIAMGHLEQEVKVSSRDEVGQLASAFNLMAMKLRETRQALETRAEELAEGRRQALAAMHEAEVARKAAEAARREVEASYRVLQKQMGEIKALENQLREQAIRDPLTNCYNRRYLEETLEREFSRAQREGYPVSLAIVDIDHFKQVNDTYGHSAGDEVLKAVSNLLQGHTRAGDVVCRYGGEEFLIMLPNLTLENAISRAEEWRQGVEKLNLSAPIEFSEDNWVEAIPITAGQIQATVSIGIACFPQHGSKKEVVIARADRALYRAKNGGRNQVISCDPDIAKECSTGALDLSHLDSLS